MGIDYFGCCIQLKSILRGRTGDNGYIELHTSAQYIFLCRMAYRKLRKLYIYMYYRYMMNITFTAKTLSMDRRFSNRLVGIPEELLKYVISFNLKIKELL